MSLNSSLQYTCEVLIENFESLHALYEKQINKQYKITAEVKNLKKWNPKQVQKQK